MAPDAVATSVSTTGSPAEYRPWLDGIRALAIFLVLIEHTNLLKNWGLGGTGVGVFFALSGYLITGLLLKEWESTGRLRLKRFYARRFARLMPGLVLSVVVCSALFLLIGRKREVLNGFFAMTYMANYAAIISGHHLSGFGHAWSLAVEEHFYIVWPAVLLLLVRRATTRWHAAAAIAVICVLDLIWRGYLAHRVGITHMWLYHGTVERLDAMLFGAIAAMLTAQRRGRAEGWTAVLLPIGAAASYLMLQRTSGPSGTRRRWASPAPLSWWLSICTHAGACAGGSAPVGWYIRGFCHTVFIYGTSRYTNSLNTYWATRFRASWLRFL